MMSKAHPTLPVSADHRSPQLPEQELRYTKKRQPWAVPGSAVSRRLRHYVTISPADWAAGWQQEAG